MNRNQEINEAISAGEQALISLKKASEMLDSAKKWGVFDMVGGGLISSVVKHSKLDNANQNIEEAKAKLKCFQDELDDVNMTIEVGDFMKFADCFFDDFFVDFMVQSKIKKAITDINGAILKVENMLDQLRDASNFDK